MPKGKPGTRPPKRARGTRAAVSPGEVKRTAKYKFSPLEKKLIGLESWLLVLASSGALVGRNRNTLFFDAEHAGAVVGREKLVDQLLLVCGHLAGNSRSLLCASIRPELFNKKLYPRDRTRPADFSEDAVALGSFVGSFLYVPLLKGEAKKLLEEGHRKLLTLARKASNPHQVLLSRKFYEWNSRQEAPSAAPHNTTIKRSREVARFRQSAAIHKNVALLRR